MRKFTIFSILSAIIVLAMVIKVVYTDYLPDWKELKESSVAASVLNTLDDLFADKDLDEQDSLKEPVFEDENQETLNAEEASITEAGDDTQEDTLAIANLNTATIITNRRDLRVLASTQDDEEIISTETEEESNIVDFEDIDYKSLVVQNYLREDQIKSAGFARAYIENEKASNILFKTVDLSELFGFEMSKFLVRDDSLFYARVYVFVPDYSVTVHELYTMIRDQVDEDSETTINETNTYANASFYLNDDRRSDTAFLTVEFNNLIYSFSYPKQYHEQIVNLIKLIRLEE